MKYKFGDTVVIALGGSIIHPGKIDVDFLKSFKKFALDWVAQSKQFVLVAGGGSVARDYQNAASQILDLSDEDKDWLGIHATRLNAHLLRTIFREVADPIVCDKRYRVKHLLHPVTIASGSRPGWSTDYIALQLAADFNVKEAIIAGSPDYVYDKDNKQFSDAKKFDRLTWREYKSIIPNVWTPGLHAPVDPVGARLAEKEKLAAIIIKGTDLDNFNDLLSGRDFKGTVIK